MTIFNLSDDDELKRKKDVAPSEQQALALLEQFNTGLQNHYGSNYEAYNKKENLVTNEQKADRLHERTQLLERFVKEEQGNISEVYQQSIETYIGTLEKQSDAIRKGDKEEFTRLDHPPAMEEANKHITSITCYNISIFWNG